MTHIFLRLPEVKRRTGKGKTSIYRDIAEGRFPRQVRNGNGSVAWLESEIHRWQQERINQR
jgi:prophage regulatory protein